MSAHKRNHVLQSYTDKNPSNSSINQQTDVPAKFLQVGNKNVMNIEEKVTPKAAKQREEIEIMWKMSYKICEKPLRPPTEKNIGLEILDYGSPIEIYDD